MTESIVFSYQAPASPDREALKVETQQFSEEQARYSPPKVCEFTPEEVARIDAVLRIRFPADYVDYCAGNKTQQIINEISERMAACKIAGFAMPDDDKIVCGDIVWLKSGSPPLTVFMVEGTVVEPMVNVVWFVNGECRRDAFSPVELTKTEIHW